MKKFFQDFKKFISRGNILDMAVGVIVGSAFSAIVTSLTNKIIDNLPLQSEAETQEIDTSNFTHRELLRNALSTVAQNDTERDFLARYQREIKDVEKQLRDGDIIKVTDKTKGFDFDVLVSLSDRQKDMIVAGGLLNYTRQIG